MNSRGYCAVLAIGSAVLSLCRFEAHAAPKNYCTYVPFMESTATNDAEGQRECRAWLKSAD